MDKHLLTIIELVAEKLTALKYTLTTAESCTGGWIAKICTDLPGSSHWFDRGYVTYSNDSKQDLLDVSTNTLEHYGAVSQQTAEAMAIGALKRSLADISVAVTGIAGPDGGSEEKPVGTVWIAWARKKDHYVTSEKFLFSGDRETIRQQAVYAALKGVLKNARDS